MSTQELIEQALRLPAADRAEVAAEMRLSLSPDDSRDVDEREWIAEIQSRREEASSGAVVMRPWLDVRADVLAMTAQRAEMNEGRSAFAWRPLSLLRRSCVT